MERLSNNIAAKISAELDLDNDNKEVIAYGSFAILQIFVTCTIVVLFGLLLHVLAESLIVLFSASILRKYSGGVHASSPGKCTLIGTVSCIGQALIISFVSEHWGNINLILFLGLVSFFYSYYTIYKLAPVDSYAKPIKSEDKRKRMKKSSMLILSVYLVTVIIYAILYLRVGTKNYFVYCFSIFAGISWQTFTLTKCGHTVIGKADTFLNHIFNKKEGKYEKAE